MTSHIAIAASWACDIMPNFSFSSAEANLCFHIDSYCPSSKHSQFKSVVWGLQYCVYHEELIGSRRCCYIQCKIRSWCKGFATFKVAESSMEIDKETWPYCDSSWLLVIAWINPVKNALGVVDLAEIISELTRFWDGTVAINMKANISLFWWKWQVGHNVTSSWCSNGNMWSHVNPSTISSWTNT